MKTEAEIREALARLYAEGSTLTGVAATRVLTDDEVRRVGAIKAEISTLRSDLDKIRAAAADAAEFGAGMREFTQGNPSGPIATRTAASPAAVRAAERQVADLGRSVSARFAASQQFTDWRARNPTNTTSPTESHPVDIRSFFHRDTIAPSAEDQRAMSAGELRALITSAGLPTDYIAPFRVPGIFMPDLPEFNVRNAFMNGQTTAALIKFYRELAFTNAAAWVAEATATSPTTLGQSGVKPESSWTLELASSEVATLAHWIAVTNQTLEDDPQMRALIEGRLIDGLKLVEDDSLVNGDGSGASLVGILNIVGIQDLDDTYFSANPVEDPSANNGDLNRLLRAMTLIRIVGRARPSFILANPYDMERFMSMTDAQRQYYGAGPFGNAAIRTIWGTPVIQTEALDIGHAVVGDGRMAAVWDRMEATIKIGLINDQLIRNMQTILAEERLAFAVYRPAAFADVELSTAA